MMRFAYTSEQVEFLRVGYLEMRIPALTEAFNQEFGTRRPETAIKAAVKNRKFRSGRKPGFTRGEQPRILTPEQHDYLVREYRQQSRETLTVKLNEKFGTDFRVSQIIAYLKNHGIKSGRTGTFEKGRQPFNKGTKGFMKPNRTSFKKGSVPKNLKPLGHERIDSKDGYVWIKVAESNPYTTAPTRYRPKHVYVWESRNGPVPDGYVVAFLDGNKLNCEPENLMLITRQELLYLNRNDYANVPEELRRSMLAVAKLECRRYELERA